MIKFLYQYPFHLLYFYTLYIRNINPQQWLLVPCFINALHAAGDSWRE